MIRELGEELIEELDDLPTEERKRIIREWERESMAEMARNKRFAGCSYGGD